MSQNARLPSNLKIGAKFLITTNQWFLAPDGNEYRAVFGTVRAILDDEATLGIRTNRNSTNWYLLIGGMVIAGCQIHYAIATNDFDHGWAITWNVHEGRAIEIRVPCRIFDADAVEEKQA